MNLVDFLDVRIAEDEQRFDLPDAATVLNRHGHVSARGEDWVTRGDCPICGAYLFDGTEDVTEEGWWDHCERYHQRSRVLADCKAKRRIVELAEEASGLDMQVDSEFRVGPRDKASEPYVGDVILRALAQPYADHPDYDPAWHLTDPGSVT